MKLALVTETYPPEVNGVAMTLSRLVGGLAARDHRVEVVRPRQSNESPHSRLFTSSDGAHHWLVFGLPLPLYKSLRMGLPAWGALYAKWRLAPPEVVHIATEGPLGWAALRAARKLRLPVTSSFHTNFHQYGGHYGLRFAREIGLRYLNRFHNRTLCTMVPTEEMKRRLADSGFSGLTVLGRGVDGRLFHPQKRSARLRTAWGAAPGDPVVIYVGRIAAEKNLELVIKSFFALQAIEPRAKLVLVGDGPQRADLARKYPQFHYAGTRRGEELAVHYASADLFLFASVTETFGNVITEAMASGLVVLSYDYAAAREYVQHGLNGFTAPLNHEEDFLRATREAMAKSAAWPAMRARARSTAERITWDAIITRFEEQLSWAIETQAASEGAKQIEARS